MNAEERLSVALHAVADHGDTATAPVAELVRRGRRRQRNWIVVRSAAVVGVVAAVGGTTMLAVSGGGDQPGQSGQVTAARVDLVSAAEATSDASFRFTFTGKSPDGVAIDCHGGLDRGADVGWEKDGSHETRFIEGTQYVKLGNKPWRAEPGTLNQSFDCTGPITNGAIDPAAVLRSLKGKGQVGYAGRTGSGQDAVDVYKYTFSLKGGQLTYNGVMEAGVASGYIRKVTTDVSGVVDGTYTITYSGFGEPVKVTAPNVR
jgi:hypothetical protein